MAEVVLAGAAGEVVRVDHATVQIVHVADATVDDRDAHARAVHIVRSRQIRADRHIRLIQVRKHRAVRADKRHFRIFRQFLRGCRRHAVVVALHHRQLVPQLPAFAGNSLVLRRTRGLVILHDHVNGFPRIPAAQFLRQLLIPGPRDRRGERQCQANKKEFHGFLRVPICVYLGHSCLIGRVA